MQHLIIGDPLDKNTDMGAVNSRTQLDTIQRYVDTGKEGASYCSAQTLCQKGFYFPPLFNRCLPIFYGSTRRNLWPVLTIQAFRTTEEALKKQTILMDSRMVSGRIKDQNISCRN